MAAVIIPDIFGSWLQGRRQAEADNWRDLNQYNSVLKGQLDNAKEMATFDPSVRKTWIGADKDLVETMKSAAQTENELLGLDSAIANNLPSLRGQVAGMNYSERLRYTPQRNALDWDTVQYNDARTRQENNRVDQFNRAADPIRLQTLRLQKQAIEREIAALENGMAAPGGTGGLPQPPAAELDPNSPYTEAAQKAAAEEAEKRRKAAEDRLNNNGIMGY